MKRNDPDINATVVKKGANITNKKGVVEMTIDPTNVINAASIVDSVKKKNGNVNVRSIATTNVINIVITNVKPRITSANPRITSAKVKIINASLLKYEVADSILQPRYTNIQLCK
jgi:hypothetical protein